MLNLAPAFVVGHSGGGSIACELVAHHPGLVRHAVIYEPPLFAAVEGGDRVAARMRSAVESVLAEHGHRRAMEAFMRANVPDEIVDHAMASLDPQDRDRVLDNGAVFIPIELPAFMSYVPDLDRMRAAGVPITVVVGEESLDGWPGAATSWLARGTGARLTRLPGGHVGFLTAPDAFLALIRGLGDGS